MRSPSFKFLQSQIKPALIIFIACSPVIAQSVATNELSQGAAALGDWTPDVSARRAQNLCGELNSHAHPCFYVD
jgi:hypothetical protein